MLNEVCALVATAEVLALGLFSIVTIRFDFPDFHNAMFGVFVVSATLHMFLRTVLSFTVDQPEPVDQCAVIVRFTCTIVFTWTASQCFQTHQRFIRNTGCHGYVTPGEAVTEYLAIGAYALFALAQLVDIRDVRFICFPRTCSGECETLRPNNFVPGAKFTHCRAFEHAQYGVQAAAAAASTNTAPRQRRQKHEKDDRGGGGDRSMANNNNNNNSETTYSAATTEQQQQQNLPMTRF